MTKKCPECSQPMVNITNYAIRAEFAYRCPECGTYLYKFRKDKPAIQQKPLIEHKEQCTLSRLI